MPTLKDGGINCIHSQLQENPHFSPVGDFLERPAKKRLRGPVLTAYTPPPTTPRR
ncbi:hypothetical protein ABMY26_08740 [Azospirillum sp. HJ39]|uniref:hypothetical protein n=1 Tax=Azospirillum sp. HJ39 TaxID=3159496 RepID=UPI00355920FE